MTKEEKELLRSLEAHFGGNKEPMGLLIKWMLDQYEEMERRISDLEQVWLPCDQTIQCAVCNWVDWGEHSGKHPETCPVGRLEKRIQKLEADKDDLENKIAGVMMTSGNFDWNKFVEWVSTHAGIKQQ